MPKGWRNKVCHDRLCITGVSVLVRPPVVVEMLVKDSPFFLGSILGCGVAVRIDSAGDDSKAVERAGSENGGAGRTLLLCTSVCGSQLVYDFPFGAGSD